METLGLIAAAGAALGSLVYIGGRLRAAWRRLRHLWQLLDTGMDIIQRELGESDPHSTNLRDDVSLLAAQIGLLQRGQRDLGRQVLRIALLGAKHHPEDTWIYREDEEPPP